MGPLEEGVQRIKCNGEAPFDVLRMTLTPHGFRLDFTKSFASASIDKDRYSLRSYRYEDTALYGGENFDIAEVEIVNVRRLGKRSIELQVDSLKGEGIVYELSNSLLDTRGDALLSEVFCDTVNRLVPESDFK